MSLKKTTSQFIQDYSHELELLKSKLKGAQAVIIGAGAGLSTSAGYVYNGQRFEKYFYDFSEKYGINDIYSGGFYPFESQEVFWAWWSRQIWINRFIAPPKPVYQKLLNLVKDKDYFVLTTNVDHCFQRYGFDKSRLFYTQGDYGLLQCSKPCHKRTYDNMQTIRDMLIAQGFKIGKDGELIVESGTTLKMSVPSSMVPKCPRCGEPMALNLRSSDTFVEDDGWFAANKRYYEFLNKHEGQKIVLLELGVGGNTPVIIKYPFWRMAYNNVNATYVCINYGQSFAPKEIESRSICIDADILQVLECLE